MLPNRNMPPPPGMPPGGSPRPPIPGGARVDRQPISPEEEINPGQARSAVLTVLSRVKAIADRFGLDLHEMVSIVEAEGAPPPPGGLPPMEEEVEEEISPPV